MKSYKCKLFTLILAILFTTTNLLANFDPEIGRFLQRDSFGTKPMVAFTSYNGPQFLFTQGPVVPNPDPTVDLSQYIDGMNLYEYVSNNPIMLTDPIGGCEQCPKCCCIDDLTIGNVLYNDDLRASNNQILKMYGHKFDVTAKMSWKKAPAMAKCDLEWMEYTDLPAIPGHQPNTWTDMYKLFPQSETFAPINNPKAIR